MIRFTSRSGMLRRTTRWSFTSISAGPAQGVKPRWFGFQRLTAEGSSDFFGAQRIATATGFISHLMFSGVFDRHPNLKIVCTEYDVGWVAIMYEQANYRYGRATAYGSDVK